jgi:hypothetical protein
MDILCRNSHGQSTCFFVGRETDDIQSTSDNPINQQGDSFAPSHLRSAICPDSIKFPSEVSVDYTLDECEWRHAHEEVERVEFESITTTSLDQVGDDCLEGCEECSE